MEKIIGAKHHLNNAKFYVERVNETEHFSNSVELYVEIINKDLECDRILQFINLFFLMLSLLLTNIILQVTFPSHIVVQIQSCVFKMHSLADKDYVNYQEHTCLYYPVTILCKLMKLARE